MLNRILELAVRQRLLVVLGTAALIAVGLWSATKLPIDAVPDITMEEFQGIKLLVSLIGLLAFAILAMQVRALWHPMGLLLAGAGCFLLPELWLRSKIQQRKQRILRLLPEVIDLLSLCVGAGVDFLGALNRVVAAEGYRNEPMVEELSVAIQEMKFGKRKAEALRAMARRVDLQEMHSFVRAIVLADRMGTPIADVLAVHAEDVRMQRFNRAERAALKAPIKLIFPLLFGIMPCVAIIVGAPVFLQFQRMNPFQR